MIKYLFLLLLFTANLLFSHDNSEFDFYGFSYDMKYCAFEIYGIEDTYSNIYIINVEKNIYEYNPFIMKAGYSNSDNQLWDLRNKNLKKVIPVLKNLKIYPHVKGTLVFYNIRINEKIKKQSFTIFNDKYELVLNELPYKNDYKMFELSITGNNIQKILQKDKALPVNRKNAVGYRLVCGYYYYGRLAVIIEYEEYGFEGYNRRQMIVTGVIKTENLEMQFD